jgi:hypothetical protein
VLGAHAAQQLPEAASCGLFEQLLLHLLLWVDRPLGVLLQLQLQLLQQHEVSSCLC